MPFENIAFNTRKNKSLQVGDMVLYYDVVNGVTGSTAHVVGNVININETNYDSYSIDVEVNSVGSIPPGAFLFFSKNITVNESGIKGYYADISLENNSSKRAELFALGAETVPSSK